MYMNGVVIRPAIARDLGAILDIYNDAVLTSTATFDTEPRSGEAHRRWFRETSAHPYAVLVADREGEILAWGCLHRFASKPAYRFTTENSIYVRGDARGDGIGKLLLAALLETAVGNGFHSVIARVTSDNPVSVRLHERLGFQQVGTEREVGYKFGRWLHVIVMQKVLEGYREPPAQSIRQHSG